jgi:hypothetical protein
LKLLRVIGVGCICLFPVNAFSHTFTLPPHTPRLIVTIPDSLEPVDTLAGAEGGVSEVRTFNVGIEPLSSADLNGAINESVQMLGQHGTIIEPTSLKQNADKMNGLDSVDLSFAIIDGNEKAAITLIAAKPGSFFALISYGSEKGFADNAQIMKSIRDSIRAAN